MLTVQEMESKDFIVQLCGRGLHRILEKINQNLTIGATVTFKKVSPEWREIIEKIETSKVKRLTHLVDQKISIVWNQDGPAISNSPILPR